MADRNDAIERVKALRAKAGDVASTEAEAEAAAMMAAKLLLKYDIEESELEDVKRLGATNGAFKTSATRLPEVIRFCWYGIQMLTETKGYADRGVQMSYIGTPHDVEMALYLTEMIVGAAKRAWLGFMGDQIVPLKTLELSRNGFMRGFGSSINTKLLEMAAERIRVRQAQVSSSTALVVVKTNLIKEWCKENGLVLRKSRSRAPSDFDQNAFHNGSDAGRRVNLNRPLGDRAEPRSKLG